MERRHKGKKLPTLLKELTEDERKDFAAAKTILIKKLVPLEFVSLEEFQKCAISRWISRDIFVWTEAVTEVASYA